MKGEEEGFSSQINFVNMRKYVQVVNGEESKPPASELVKSSFFILYYKYANMMYASFDSQIASLVHR
jgi:hypothetical protein